MFSSVEKTIWQQQPEVEKPEPTVEEINQKYEKGEQRIVTESNREKLPNFVAALAKTAYMDLRPFYQRRARWDEDRQSRLIESFIVNIPVPPIFLYEKAFNSYEVMDGQQRISAIRDFYANKFALCGLQLWPELNGMRYSDLPSKVRAGIDRRSISSIVLLKESAPDDEEAIILRQIVFERLNTGGVKLERQEIRNAIYQGPLNDVVLQLTRENLFRQLWGLPVYSPEEETNTSLPIHEINFYAQMEDAEVVLRFFALRHVAEYRRGMQGFLDLYMIKARLLGDTDIGFLRKLFLDTLALAFEIYGDLTFKPFDKKRNQWAPQPQKAFYDAVMVGLATHLAKRDALIAAREKVREETKNLFLTHEEGTFTGRGNSKTDVQTRINLMAGLFGGI
ncbi:MAG TPA: DUF262 domain-containing protein [Opitutaceae bacterium]|nr:DUF262 domain-containing protein [Opitutaceae bacterium]HWC58443.1 DUF262 domain-containing protein [Verrucomicrobiae bacterium]